MLELHGNYHPPRSARRLQAVVILDDDGTIVRRLDSPSGPGNVSQDNRLAAGDVVISRGLSGLPRVFEFPDGGKFECPDVPEIDAWLHTHNLHRGTGLLQKLERHWRWVTVSVVLVAVLGILAVTVGIPASAGWLSGLVPSVVRIELGRQTEAIVMRLLDDPQLDEERYDTVRAAFDRLSAPYQDDDFRLRLAFRSSRHIGPNAFAIPNGTIVMTDEMLEFAEDDRAVIGVLAHELGHLVHRHGLQVAIQSASLPILVTLLSGDLGSGSAMLGTIPTTLVENSYSRRHEREADEFALRVLHENDIPTQPLADLFAAVLSKYGDMPGWISTHPATQERVELFTEETTHP